MSLAAKLRRAPVRVVTGAFILNSGLSKLGAGDETAQGVHGMASGAYPFFGKVPPATFAKGVGVGETALGAALLLPIVPAGLAGAGLVAFSGGLLGMYWRTPGMHEDGSPRPTQQGIAIAKDSWMLGIGTGLLVDAIVGDTGATRRVRRAERKASKVERKIAKIERKADRKSDLAGVRADLASRSSDLTADAKATAKARLEAAKKAAKQSAKTQSKAARKAAEKQADAARKLAQKQAEAARKLAQKQAEAARKATKKQRKVARSAAESAMSNVKSSAESAFESASDAARKVADKVGA